MSIYLTWLFVGYLIVVYACRWKCKDRQQTNEDGDCQFPDWLQTYGDGDAWLMRPTADLSVQVTIKTDEILATECRMENNGQDCFIHKSVSNCRKRFADDTFLIQMRDQLDETPIFRCIQFFRRSNTAVQIKSSDFQMEESDDLCSNRLVYIEGSPMIRTKNGLLPDEVSSLDIIPCLIHSAYVLNIYNVRDPCSNLTLSVHLKSDCMPTRGMTLVIEKNECRKRLPGLEENEGSIDFSCLATWKNEVSGSLYSVVTRNDMNTDIWCIFIEQGDSERFGIIMSQRVCRHESRAHGDQYEDLHFRIAMESNETCQAFPETVANKPTNTGCSQIVYNTLVVWMLCIMFVVV